MQTSQTSPNGYSDEFGPNVANILAQATRVIRGRVPQQVRAQLRAAVKAGVLGHLPKDGLKPEIFFHPAHKNGALDRQRREAEYSVGLIRRVIDHPAALIIPSRSRAMTQTATSEACRDLRAYLADRPSQAMLEHDRRAALAKSDPLLAFAYWIEAAADRRIEGDVCAMSLLTDMRERARKAIAATTGTTANVLYR